MLVNLHHRALQQDAPLRHLKLLRHVRHEPPDDRLDLAADHALVRAGEAAIAQKRRAAGKDLLVGGLHVRVRADDGAHAAIEHPRQRDLLRRRLRMEIDEDDLGRLAQTLDFRQRGMERDSPAPA